MVAVVVLEDLVAVEDQVVTEDQVAMVVMVHQSC